MHEQYTDKQIVEMLVPKLTKAVPEVSWDAIKANPDFHSVTNKMIATIYRSAYIRGQLGRSFIIGEPKQTEHWVPATKDNVKVGSKVRMIKGTTYKDNPQWYPDAGTVGTVTEVWFPNYLIQWPKGTTSETDKWCCDNTRLEVLLCE